MSEFQDNLNTREPEEIPGCASVLTRPATPGSAPVGIGGNRRFVIDTSRA
jgi:hypothetical protein